MRNKQWIWLAAGLIAFVLIGMAFVRPEAEEYPPHLMQSPSPTGTKALSEWILSSGAEVQYWRRDWLFLPDGIGQWLLVIQPYTEYDHVVDVLHQWIEAGNHVWIADVNPESRLLPDGVTIKAGEEESSNDAELGEDSNPLSTSVVQTPNGVFRVTSITNRYRLTGVETSGGEIWIEDDHGVVTARWAIGTGTLTIHLAPQWLQNGQMLSDQQFEVWTPLFTEMRRSNTVVFMDGYYHGQRSNLGTLAVYPLWLAAALIPMALILLLWIWRRGTRYGPIYLPREWVIRRGDETMQASAGWYQRQQASAEALAMQQRYLRQQLQDRLTISLNVTDDDVQSVLRERKLHQEADLWQQWLRCQVQLQQSKRMKPKHGAGILLKASQIASQLDEILPQRGRRT